MPFATSAHHLITVRGSAGSDRLISVIKNDRSAVNLSFKKIMIFFKLFRVFCRPLAEFESDVYVLVLFEQGDDGFRQVENRINADLAVKHSVIATGGSVIYGREAMQHLKKIGVVIYLKLSCESIAARLGDLRKRGITLREGQTLQQLYDERVPLYERYADITVDCENKSIREIVAEIVARLPK